MLNENQQEYDNNTIFEKSVHGQLNNYYLSLGWKIKDRVGKVEYDLQIEDVDGTLKTIEEKVIRNVYDKYISIEIVQDLLTLRAGWIHYSKADLLCWAMCNNGKLEKVLIYDYKELKKWWIKNAIHYDYKSLRLDTTGKGLTLNQLILFKDIEILQYKQPQPKRKLTPIPCEKCNQLIERYLIDEVEEIDFPCRSCGWKP